LAIDWYLDPSFGTSPSSRQLGSTEAVCNSLAHRNDIRQKIDFPDLPDLRAIADLLPKTSGTSFSAQDIPPPELAGTDPVHGFMSMQC
jgi:hypothetical protein